MSVVIHRLSKFSSLKPLTAQLITLKALKDTARRMLHPNMTIMTIRTAFTYAANEGKVDTIMNFFVSNA